MRRLADDQAEAMSVKRGREQRTEERDEVTTAARHNVLYYVVDSKLDMMPTSPGGLVGELTLDARRRVVNRPRGKQRGNWIPDVRIVSIVLICLSTEWVASYIERAWGQSTRQPSPTYS